MGKSIAAEDAVVGGPQPIVDQYMVIASSATALFVELEDSNGTTLWEGSVTVPTSAATLASLVKGLGGSAPTAWANAVGGQVRNDGVNDIHFNTGCKSDGVTVVFAPTLSSIGKWSTGSSYKVGFIS